MGVFIGFSMDEGGELTYVAVIVFV